MALNSFYFINFAQWFHCKSKNNSEKVHFWEHLSSIFTVGDSHKRIYYVIA